MYDYRGDFIIACTFFIVIYKVDGTRTRDNIFVYTCREVLQSEYFSYFS